MAIQRFLKPVAPTGGELKQSLKLPLCEFRNFFAYGVILCAAVAIRPNARIPLELEYADRPAGRHLPEAGVALGTHWRPCMTLRTEAGLNALTLDVARACATEGATLDVARMRLSLPQAPHWYWRPYLSKPRVGGRSASYPWWVDGRQTPKNYTAVRARTNNSSQFFRSPICP